MSVYADYTIYGILIGLAVCLLVVVGAIVYHKITNRYFPGIAARRAFQRSKRAERALEKHKARGREQDERLLKWAKGNLGDPVARYLLDKELARVMVDRVRNGSLDEDQEPNILDELRESQREDDEAAARYERYKCEREERKKAHLSYTLENPESPEARRHLEESLDETLTELSHVDSDLNYEEFSLKYLESDDPKHTQTATRISELQAQRKQLGERVTLIHEALERVPGDQ